MNINLAETIEKAIESCKIEITDSMASLIVNQTEKIIKECITNELSINYEKTSGNGFFDECGESKLNEFGSKIMECISNTSNNAYILIYCIIYAIVANKYGKTKDEILVYIKNTLNYLFKPSLIKLIKDIKKLKQSSNQTEPQPVINQTIANESVICQQQSGAINKKLTPEEVLNFGKIVQQPIINQPIQQQPVIQQPIQQPIMQQQPVVQQSPLQMEINEVKNHFEFNQTDISKLNKSQLDLFVRIINNNQFIKTAEKNKLIMLNNNIYLKETGMDDFKHEGDNNYTHKFYNMTTDNKWFVVRVNINKNVINCYVENNV